MKFHPSSILFALSGTFPDCPEGWDAYVSVMRFIFDALHLEKYFFYEALALALRNNLSLQFGHEFCHDFLAQVCAPELIAYAHSLEVNRKAFLALPSEEAFRQKKQEAEEIFGTEISLDEPVVSDREILSKLDFVKFAHCEWSIKIAEFIVFKPLEVIPEKLSQLQQLPHSLLEKRDLSTTLSFSDILTRLRSWATTWLPRLKNVATGVFRVTVGKDPFNSENMGEYTWPEHTPIKTVRQFIGFLDILQQIIESSNLKLLIQMTFVDKFSPTFYFKDIISHGDLVLRDFALWIEAYQVGGLGLPHPILRTLAVTMMGAAETYTKTEAPCLNERLVLVTSEPEKTPPEHVPESSSKNVVNIEGLDRAKILVALYDNAKHSCYVRQSIRLQILEATGKQLVNIYCRPDEYKLPVRNWLITQLHLTEEQAAVILECRSDVEGQAVVECLTLTEQQAAEILKKSRYVDCIGPVAIKVSFGDAGNIDVTKYNQIYSDVKSAEEVIKGLREQQRDSLPPSLPAVSLASPPALFAAKESALPIRSEARHTASTDSKTLLEEKLQSLFGVRCTVFAIMGDKDIVIRFTGEISEGELKRCHNLLLTGYEIKSKVSKADPLYQIPARLKLPWTITVDELYSKLLEPPAMGMGGPR